MEIPTRQVLETRTEFQDAIRTSLALAALIGAREIWLSDADFSAWPLGERSVVENLDRWAGPHRRMTLFAHSFDEVARRHGRWTAWRRQWSHVVECRTASDIEAARFPTICLVTEAVSVRLADTVRHRGMLSRETIDAVECREAIDAVLQRSVEAFPATTLGL
ncbi:MAG: hypothetical protein ABIV63_11005 [Caldimonas sp.]